jgi:hypothetical protein
MRILIFIALTVLIFSCRENVGTKKIDSIVNIKEIRILSKPDSLITKISEIASEIEYIPLQPSANTRLRNIDKIISRGNKIYINLVNDIMCFNNKGEFLYQLYGNRKEKEENVVAIYDFDIDTGDTSLIVLYGNRLLHFKNSEKGFGYRNTLKLGNVSPIKLDFVPGTNKILLSATRMKGSEPSINMLISINKDKLCFKPYYFRSFNSIENRFWDDFVHYQFENTMYFKERFNDTVFLVNSQLNNFTPAFILNSRLSSTNSENIKDPNYFRLLPFVTSIFEVPGYLYYEYYINGKSYQIFYSKSENKKYEIDTWNGFLKDDIAGGPDFDLEYCREGKIYSWTGARDLKKYIESEDFANAIVQNPKRKDDLRKLANSLKETDNPVLIVVTPKK